MVQGVNVLVQQPGLVMSLVPTEIQQIEEEDGSANMRKKLDERRCMRRKQNFSIAVEEAQFRATVDPWSPRISTGYKVV
jgi:hypothetical protein